MLALARFEPRLLGTAQAWLGSPLVGSALLLQVSLFYRWLGTLSRGFGSYVVGLAPIPTRTGCWCPLPFTDPIYWHK